MWAMPTLHKPEYHMPTWEEQWKRVERYYQRFKEMNDGFTGHGEPSEYHFDDMLAFFQNCLHLRDWLEEDKFISKNISMEPKVYLNSTGCLAICRDLANGTKHMKLRPNSIKSGSEPKRGPRRMEATMGSQIISLSTTIEHNGKMIDAFTLATECMAAWKKYLY